MKHWSLILFVSLLATQPSIGGQPPFHGTIFIESQLITADDPSSFQSITARGQGLRRMYDRRDGGRFHQVNAWLFDASYTDGLQLEVQVNPEFDQPKAAELAEKFAHVLGQLPHCLRLDAKTVWIHAGHELFGGGNENYLIHTEMATEYESSGILEETLMHEGSHTSLDGRYASTDEWRSAQQQDDAYISNYARDNPQREDIAESFVPYLAVRFREDRIRPENAKTIRETIPNRLQYFDSLKLDLRPFAENPPPNAR